MEKKSRRRRSTQVIWHRWYSVAIGALCILAGIGLKSITSGRASEKWFPRVDGFRAEQEAFGEVKYTAYATAHEVTDLDERLEAKQNQFILVCVWDKPIDYLSNPALEMKDRIFRIDGVTKVVLWRYGVAIWKYSPSIESTEPRLRIYEWAEIWKQAKPHIEDFFKNKTD